MAKYVTQYPLASEEDLEKVGLHFQGFVIKDCTTGTSLFYETSELRIAATTGVGRMHCDTSNTKHPVSRKLHWFLNMNR